MNLVTRSITVVRGGTDLRTGAWSETSRHDEPGCMADFTSTAEPTGTGDMVIVNATVYQRSATGLDVEATDRVEIDDATYDVVGDPAPFTSPFTGGLVGTVIRLVQHRG